MSGAPSLSALRERVRSNPDDADAHLALGRALLQSDGRLDEAASVLERAVALAPRSARGWSDLAIARLRMGDHRGALVACDRAAGLAPADPSPWANRAQALLAAGDPGGAEAAVEQALRRAPSHPLLHLRRGELLLRRGAVNAALEAFERARAIAPAHPAAWHLALSAARRLARWDLVEVLERGIARQTEEALAAGRAPVEDPWTHLARQDAPDVNKRIAAAHARRIEARVGGAPPPRPRADRPGRPLRVGYLSNDFHNHATAQLLVGVLERHRPERVRATLYDHGPEDDHDLTRRLRAAARRVDLRGLTDAAAADRIRADGLDLLVDLKGHTRGARLGILAHRPAPMQLTWLGHPGTTGARFVDVALVDEIVVPPEQAGSWTERLAYLPGSYQPNDPSRPRPDPADRATVGLPEGRFVFASFNAPWKIDPPTFELWCRVLCRAPESVLWVLVSGPEMLDALRSRARTLGVAPDRIVSAGRAPYHAHLARIPCADLVLDTLRVNGHTTTSEVLWMGVPVLTRPGRGMAARVSASLVAAAGVPELAVADDRAYVEWAVQLATDPPRLRTLRTRLAEGRATCRLFDAAAFAADLEDLFEAILTAPPGTGPIRLSRPLDPPPGPR